MSNIKDQGITSNTFKRKKRQCPYDKAITCFQDKSECDGCEDYAASKAK